MKKSTWRGILTSLCLSAVSATAGENLVRHNSSFEIGLNDWLQRNTNYNVKQPGFWSHLPADTDSSTAAIGKSSVRMRNPRGDFKYLVYPYLDLKPNKKYTISCYAKTDTPGVKVRMGVRIYASKDTVGKNIYFRPTREWKRYSGTIEFKQVPNYTQRLLIGTSHFHHRGPGPTKIKPATVWFDGVQLEEGPLSAYKSGSPHEMNVSMNNERGNRYYEGEKAISAIKLYSESKKK
jgi:hypothetical protein